MEPKPLFDVKYWEDAYRFLQKIDEASRLKILENIDKGRYALDPKLLKKADRERFGSSARNMQVSISTVGLLG